MDQRGETEEREANRRMVGDAFERFVTGDARPFFDLVADDVRWTVIGSTAISGTFTSKRDFFRNAMGKVSDGLAEPLTGSVRRILADGDLVVVQWDGAAATTGGGRYDQTYCWVLTVADGRIVEVTAYLDTEMVTAALG